MAVFIIFDSEGFLQCTKIQFKQSHNLYLLYSTVLYNFVVLGGNSLVLVGSPCHRFLFSLISM